MKILSFYKGKTRTQMLDAWAGALRAPRYRQGTEELHTISQPYRYRKFSVAGVLCDSLGLPSKTEPSAYGYFVGYSDTPETKEGEVPNYYFVCLPPKLQAFVATPGRSRLVVRLDRMKMEWREGYDEIFTALHAKHGIQEAALLHRLPDIQYLGSLGVDFGALADLLESEFCH